MLIKLIRNEPQGLNIFGRMSVDNGAVVMDTLEHLEYAIPDGFYRLRMTYSPSFQQILPILDGVLGYARQPHNGIRRTGIRIHAGNTISHSRGCILVGDRDKNPRLLSSKKRLNELVNHLLNYQKLNPHEEIYIDISSPDPYPLADTPYPTEA
jgi:hypothetical protein